MTASVLARQAKRGRVGLVDGVAVRSGDDDGAVELVGHGVAAFFQAVGRYMAAGPVALAGGVVRRVGPDL